MAEGKFVSYLRVSTDRQGASGLGVEAQRRAVGNYLNGGSWKLIDELVEIESGKRNDRPQLQKALTACRLHGATLLVARLDRLARNAHFLLGLKEAGVEFVACDMPSANRLTVGILAMVAEEEARLISTRTREALQAAKARGIKLGMPRNLTPRARRIGNRHSAISRKAKANRRAVDLNSLMLEAKQQGNTSLSEIAGFLNDRGIPAPRGGPWSRVQVGRILSILPSTEVAREVVSNSGAAL